MATKKATTTKKSTKKAHISAEDIRRKAEEIYRDRINNGKVGDELSDWLQAEKQLSKVK